MRRFSPKSADNRVPSRKPRAFRPLLETLEDRTVPTIGGWALQADPEGYVFHDINGNGVFDSGEPSMGAGLTVYVDTNENGVLDSGEINTTTDATGHYSILLPDGTYSIRVIAPAGFQDDSRPFGTLVKDFPSVESGSNNNFSGLAWANGSLYQTFERVGGTADNVMYQIDPQTGAAIGPAVSIPGDIFEITFDGTDFWGADYNNNYLIRFNFAGQELQRLSFTDIKSPTGIEWDGSALRVLDDYSNRIYQIDPSGSGTILGSISTPNETVESLAFDGTYLWVLGFDSHTVYGLDPATGTVQRSFGAPGSQPVGLAVHGTNLWLADASASRVFQYDLGYGGGRIVTVAGADVTGVNLAVFQPASISGRVFSDNNQNGVQDANDGGVPSWRVYIDSTSNGQFDQWETSAVTDTLGNYTLSGLRPGESYTVASDLAGQRLTRWSPVAPAGGVYSITLNSGDALSGKDFASFLDRSAPRPNEWGDFEGGRMNLYTGLSWVDSFSLSRNAGDYASALIYAANSTYGGFEDWRLPTKDEAVTAAQNDAKDAQFLSVSGNYAWWTSTSYKKGVQWVVNLNNGAASTATTNGSLLIAMVRDPAIVIDDGSAGYTDNGWTLKSVSSAYSADERTAPAGNGSKTATWTFSGLEVGATYKVAVTWSLLRGAATNAPFMVRDGTTAVASQVINESVAPTDFSTANTFWQGLGTFTLNSNTLSVQLSNLANGTVIADAVRIFKVFPSYAPAAPLTAESLPSGSPAAQKLTVGAVKPLLKEAIRRWEALGVSPTALHGIDVGIADLGGSTLGIASGHTITLDDNAAGWGWFVDKTARSDSEFNKPGNQGEQNRMDLLTVLMHEVGHIIGYEHTTTPGSLMNETLAAGTRENPGTGLVTQTDFWGSLIAQAQMKKQKSLFGAFLTGSE